jgi:hypothetical protein
LRSLSQPNLRRLGTAGIAAAFAASALLFAYASRDQPLIALAIPAVLGTAILCARWPAATITGILFLSGSYGTLQANGSPSVGPVIDLILAALWVTVLLTHLVKERDRPLWIAPGLALLVLFIGIAFLEIGTATSVGLGVKSFSYSTWYMTVVPLLALAGWRLGTYLDISKGIVLVTLLVAGYAVLRLLIGPSSSERIYAIESAGPYTTIGGSLSLVGSFPSRHALAFWVACAAPLCLAVALIDRRQLRTPAAVAVGLCLPAAYGTDVRAAIPALIAGGGTVIILNQLSSGAKALRQTVVAVAIAVVGGTILFSTVTGSNSGRYGAILSPGGDPSYQAHIRKWEDAVSDIGGHPFGLGLGTAGRLAETGQNGVVTIASYNLDNSYLKIAYEQGFIVLALFVATMIALLVGLARRGVRARSPGVRALATGAAGSLVAAAVMFFTGIYVEGIIAFAVWIPVGAAIGAIGAESARPAD